MPKEHEKSVPGRSCGNFHCLSLESRSIIHISLVKIDAIGFPNGKGLRNAVFLCTQEDKVKVLVAHLHPTLSYLMDGSLPGSCIQDSSLS